MKTKIYSEYFWDKDIIINAILSGNVIASIVSVSASGMSRKIRFGMMHEGKFVNITREIFFLYNNYFDFDKFDGYVKVTGCGMDMIFHTLYYALGHKLAKDWNQRYITF